MRITGRQFGPSMDRSSSHDKELGSELDNSAAFVKDDGFPPVWSDRACDRDEMGEFTVCVGGSSAGRLSAKFTLSTSYKEPR
jgi:hypothetical protein